MQKITLQSDEIIEINGVQINAEFLTAAKNFQEQHQQNLSKGKIPGPYFSLFHPGPNQSMDEIYQYLLLTSNNIEFLERILFNHEICRDGFEALIEYKDQFISLGADLQKEVFTDNYIENRPGILKSIESLNIDIAKLKLEIEDEKVNPSDISMGVRLYNRLGHL